MSGERSKEDCCDAAPEGNLSGLPLSEQELERYSRQLILPEISFSDQLMLRNSRVAIDADLWLGALYLAGAGVGHIDLIGKEHPAAARVADAARRLNPQVTLRHLSECGPAEGITIRNETDRLQITAEGKAVIIADAQLPRHLPAELARGTLAALHALKLLLGH